MPRNSTVLDLSGPLADHHLGCDMRPGLALRARPRHPQRPAGAQARDELALECATAFDVKGLVDRHVAACCAPSMTAPAARRPGPRPGGEPDPRAAPARTRAAGRWQPAWPSSAAAPPDRTSTARP